MLDCLPSTVCPQLFALVLTLAMGELQWHGAFDERVTRVYTRQLLHGLNYLHLNSIVHRDIKGANVLLSISGEVKLADFGCAKNLAELAGNSNSGSTGTPYWMAPEQIKGEAPASSADIWSLGATVIEMLTAKHPWSHLTNDFAAMWQIAKSQEPPEAPDSLSRHGRDFLDRCFRLVAGDRSTATGKNHPFLNCLSSLCLPSTNLGAVPLRQSCCCTRSWQACDRQ